jgi:lauroyl/myristoyl acyltransferase
VSVPAAADEVPTESLVRCTIYEDKPTNSDLDAAAQPTSKSAEELSYNTAWMNQHIEAWEQAYCDPEMWTWLFSR